MTPEKQLLQLAMRIRALSQTGLCYSTNEYDRERYSDLTSISDQIVSLTTGLDQKTVTEQYIQMKEYITPKTDIRTVVFNDKDEILLVQEQADRCWSLPGGWADIGYSPSEIAIKEVKEETGLDVKPLRLLAVEDMSKHAHPSIPFYVYKFFILCKQTGGTFTETFDITDKGFFSLDELPPLSLERVLPEQIQQMYFLSKNPEFPVYMD